MAVQYASWIPETEEDRAKVRIALGEVLESTQFRNSKRYPALLSYLVEETLAGRTEIKERTLGIEVFGRPANYDTNADTAVRYTAGEIRKRLALYYHSHPDSQVQIALTSRSYIPEFLCPTAAAEHTTLPPESIGTITPFAHGIPDAAAQLNWKRVALSLAALLVCIGCASAGLLLWRLFRPDPVKAFWSPYLGSNITALVCPGGNIFEANRPGEKIQPADDRTPTPYLSFGNGVAMGRMAADISRLGGHYRIEAAGQTPLSHLSEGPAVLIGAYNNAWTERLLLPLRFHFSPAPQKGIIDSATSGRIWTRDTSDVENSPDYALVARFHSNSTGNMVVVAAGLKRFGTDAASQFLSSADDLRQLDDRLGTDWPRRNLEVVLKVDVASGRVGAPQILDAYSW